MYEVIAMVDGVEVVFFRVDSEISAKHNAAYLVVEGWQGVRVRKV